MNNKKNISYVVKKNGCSGCGTCKTICPRGAISYIKTANGCKFIVDKKKCNNCGLCLKVCPGVGINYNFFNLKLYGSEYQNEIEQQIGKFKHCYYSYAKDNNVRYNATSGGTITNFLIFLLEKKYIDGAVVCSNIDRTYQSHQYIATSKEEILQSMGSKYVPVPLNFILKEISKKKNKKYAFVGLPCHIHGLLKFAEINPSIMEKIFIRLGIVCGQTVNFTGIKWFLKYKKIPENEVKEIKFRGSGWPGKFTVILKDNCVYKFNYLDYFTLFTLGFFTPTRCMLCTDFLNEFADISFADAWVKEKIKKDNIGSNVVITRTTLGDSLLREAEDYINLEKINENKVLECTEVRLGIKRSGFKTNTKIARLFNILVPFYNRKFSNTRFLLKAMSIFSFIISILSNKFYKLFLLIPPFFWKLFLYIYRKSLKIISKKYE